MSRAAQEIQRLVDEMRRSREKDRKVAKGVPVSEHEEKESVMSAEKPATRRAAKKSAIAKATTKPRVKKSKDATFPDPGDLRLESGGITTSGESRYINFKFTNGLVVRLQDATANRTDAIKVRDLMSAWFIRRMGA